MQNTEEGQILLHLARAAIGKELGFATHDLPRTAWLEQPGATFVTLHLHGELRGCIGSLEARQALIDDVQNNARASAFRDPRFKPLGKEEFSDVVIDVSLLGKSEPIRFSDEEDAVAQLRPDKDGVIMEYGLHRATFLPQVWSQLPSPREFLARLKEKAGLSSDFWSTDIRLSRYAVREWSEGEQNG
jgi:AmmeMemoRadiSam system protein A